MALPHRENYASIVISTLLHTAVLVGMSLWTLDRLVGHDELVLDSVFESVERREEISQVLDSMTLHAPVEGESTSGMLAEVPTTGTSAPQPQVHIDLPQRVDEPAVPINVGDATLLSRADISLDLGERQVTGETAAVVDGYDTAMGRMADELIRLLRDRKLLVVWLFDKSQSMKDDQAEIRQKFHQAYERLGTITKQDRGSSPSVMSVVAGFGRELNLVTSKPTDDLDDVRAAIDKIGMATSGTENTFAAIAAAIEELQSMARAQHRRLVLIVATDESGDDAGSVERSIEVAREAEAVVYFFGREAVFGYPYAHTSWKDPVYGLSHWLRMRRGPETAMPETLQWNGFRSRWDAFSSGFGPYAQARLARETGGIFFLLPGGEANLIDAGERRFFDSLDMKPYQPELKSLEEYQQARDASPFRKTVSHVIQRLNPYRDEELNIRFHHYPLSPAEFREQGRGEFDKAVRALQLANQGLQLLESVGPLRATEPSQRWRANYDLLVAQLAAYRVRLFQYLLAMDQHAKSGRPPDQPQSNEWNIRHTSRLLPPDTEQERNTGVDVDEIARQRELAKERFEAVIEEHPGTPWAQRAARELQQGFGIEFAEGFRDPNYRHVGVEFQLPEL